MNDALRMVAGAAVFVGVVLSTHDGDGGTMAVFGLLTIVWLATVAIDALGRYRDKTGDRETNRPE